MFDTNIFDAVTDNTGALLVAVGTGILMGTITTVSLCTLSVPTMTRVVKQKKEDLREKGILL